MTQNNSNGSDVRQIDLVTTFTAHSSTMGSESTTMESEPITTNEAKSNIDLEHLMKILVKHVNK